jgi:hypothetical protein
MHTSRFICFDCKPPKDLETQTALKEHLLIGRHSVSQRMWEALLDCANAERQHRLNPSLYSSPLTPPSLQEKCIGEFSYHAAPPEDILQLPPSSLQEKCIGEFSYHTAPPAKIARRPKQLSHMQPEVLACDVCGRRCNGGKVGLSVHKRIHTPNWRKTNL